jgi:cobalt-zinc-cadmium efflux system membrane fusion protein
LSQWISKAHAAILITIPYALEKASEGIIAQSHYSGASMAVRKVTITLTTVVAVAILSFVAGAYSVGNIGGWLKSWLDATSTDASAQGSGSAAVRTATLSSGHPGGVQSVELNDKQLASVKVEVVGDYVFPVEKAAVGSIDFNEELSVQVFTPYQGKIIDVFAKVG